MNVQVWLAALSGELSRHGVGPELAGHVVAEAATHLRDSGETPLQAFGPPAAYAAAVADSVGRPSRRAPGGVRLEVRDVAKRYRRHAVLDGVDLTVRAGEIAAVVGANGSGKSTFLRICAGLASPDRGTVRVHGTLGYCPQDSGTCGFQMIMDPAGASSRVLPFWFSREMGTYAVDHTDAGYLARGLVQGTVVALLLTALVAALSGIRLRNRSHLQFLAPQQPPAPSRR